MIVCDLELEYVIRLISTHAQLCQCLLYTVHVQSSEARQALSGLDARLPAPASSFPHPAGPERRDLTKPLLDPGVFGESQEPL